VTSERWGDSLKSEVKTLSFVSCVRIKFILIEVYNLPTEVEVNWDAVFSLLTDAKLPDSQIRTVLSLIVQNAVRFDVDTEGLTQAVRQLRALLLHP
jgi:hypothetical protein